MKARPMNPAVIFPLLFALLSFAYSVTAAPPIDEAWIKSVERAAPTSPTIKPRSGRPSTVLVFSLATGYKHSVIPFVDRVFEILGRTSGAFKATISVDIEDLMSESLVKYDVLVLNNTCSVGKRRNLLLDVLESNPKYKDLSQAQRQAKAAAIEQSILNFVRNGKGLIAMHGSPTLLNNSAKFTAMVGGSFDYHPPFQQVTVRTVDAAHPLVAAFRGKGPLVYKDEPYCFKGAYQDKDFLPLLAFETKGVRDPRGQFADDDRYAAWIKPYGKGRVFFCSPGHDQSVYENPVLLRFMLDGFQYAVGDLECNDK